MESSFEERLERESPLEWWFVHGKLRGPGLSERYFMFSLFRYAVSAQDALPFEGCAALVSVLDPATGVNKSCSRADRRLLRAIENQEIADALDPNTPRAVHDELRRFGFPGEFETSASDPEFRAEPFACRWEEISIGMDEGVCRLNFREPRNGIEYELTLTPEAPRLSVEAAGLIGCPGQTMNYATYPRLRLEGTAGGAPVAGHAWFDHQWGGRGWLQSDDQPPRPLGWDWMGFHLDDGSSWLVARHWDILTREELCRYLTVRTADGAVRTTQAFEWTPARWWNSAATRTTYPVEWRLRAPEFDAEVTFTPLADSQELRFLSSMRSIWEGAGVVRGRVGGRAVQADARLEGQGYGYVRGPADYLNRWSIHLDSAFTRQMPAAVREGKRAIAVLSCLLLEALGQSPLADGRLNSRQRLGVWTACLRLGLRTSQMFAGDEFRAGRLDRPTLDEWMADSIGPRLRAAYVSKTAASARDLAGAAAAIGQLDGVTRAAVESFVGAVGLALQYVTDANGFAGPGPSGKPHGAADLAAGKLNYALYHALRLLPPASGERLRDLLCQRALRTNAAALIEGIELVAASGACEAVREEARKVVSEAWIEFSRHARPSIAKTELRLLVESLLENVETTSYASDARLAS